MMAVKPSSVFSAAPLPGSEPRPAVHLHDFACDERGVVRCEIEHDARHVLRLALAAERRALDGRGAAFRRAEGVVEARADETRRDAVDADADRKSTRLNSSH